MALQTMYLPSGAGLEIDRDHREITLDRLPCTPKRAWPAETCDAVNRLAFTASVRRRPSRNQLPPRTWVQPHFTLAMVEIPRDDDTESIAAALMAADAGDAMPASRLAYAWFDELPADCGWRFDLCYEVQRATLEGPVSRDEIWEALRHRPDAAGLRRSHVSMALLALVRDGSLEVTPGGRYTLGSVQLPYDPMLGRDSFVASRAHRRAGVH